ncbi:MAG: glutamate racemase [Armatimonadetes bacterium]|nr:glutamate racemase [Armatimonadota bacterium]
MSRKAPIGIFDSGLGGLTVAKQIMKRLPYERIAYLGDQIHVPYGERSADEIRSFALGITEFLIRQNAKLVIMACNMSSATALEEARELFPQIPILGVIEAGARSAVSRAQCGPIGVLATTGTVSTRAYTKTLQKLLPNIEVIEQPCPKFVPLVEAGKFDSPEAEMAVIEYTEPLLSAGCRTIILGCTHYPFLTDTIRRVVGPDVTIVDPAEETAAEAEQILLQSGITTVPGENPEHTYYTTGSPERFAEHGSRFLGCTVENICKVSWESDLGAIAWQEKMAERTMKSAL